MHDVGLPFLLHLCLIVLHGQARESRTKQNIIAASLTPFSSFHVVRWQWVTPNRRVALLAALPGPEGWTSRTGGTARWRGAAAGSSAATPAPPWTARTAGCPRRNPTALARPSRPMTTTAGCTMAIGCLTWCTGSRMSFQDKVCLQAGLLWRSSAHSLLLVKASQCYQEF